ncbi:MAG: hypothetical protein FP816_06695 [Desulfobacteraceae bacterium]|nr:hypothetical protein [Desulfobacteraceae bacterium]MBU4054136.1 hypothetical protein [Pseudomonadota bacterium]
MNRPVRTTLVLAFLCGFVIYPALVTLLTPVLGWPATAKLVLWALTAVYSFLLARWSNTKAQSILFPLVLLLGAALWPDVYAGFFLLLLGVMSWIRSGICFQDKPMRGVLAELITIGGGISMAGLWLPSSMLQWELGIWLFGLVQCLYFYIIAYGYPNRVEKVAIDPFEQARQELERVLERQ